jgi:Domain of unknown function (DUF4124)
MLMKIVIFMAAFFCSTLGYSGEIYRWTDARGQIHYGDVVPDSQKRNSKVIRLTGTLVKGIQLPQSGAWNPKDSYSPILKSGNSAVPDPTVAITKVKNTCEEQWKKFHDSWACFNPYRNSGGSVKSEAYQHCSEVKQPESCY